ncbi:hypothetical protein GGR52DRAFT_5265 [Hypoxylon sp. FL1284]|nr:hypothetical protein GGR52DRAFT_5265 [Hypoxylon sp. FL1284]
MNGSESQRSQEGLLRTLLFTILRECPDMIPKAIETLDNLDYDWGVWRPGDLLKLVQHLSSRDFGIKFCFLIDGLDECEGDHGDLITFLRELTRSQDMKICVSSRPWTRFVDAYGQDSDRFLKLEEFTQGDIRTFVLDTLHSHQLFQAHAADPRYTKLVDTIVERANGVFLWVFLVCKSLLDGMRHADRLIDLERRLTFAPPDIESFFRNMLLSTDKVYKKQTARLFWITLAVPKPLPSAIYWVLDMLEENPLAGIDSDQFNSLHHVEQMSRRLDARSKGLVEIRYENFHGFNGSSSMNLWTFAVEFIHSSVHDFLRTPEMNTAFIENAEDDFDCDILLCEAFVAAVGLPLGSLHYTLNQIVYYAGNIERSKGITLPCLEQLDTQLNGIFLTRAVEAGLGIYVKTRLSRSPPVLHVHQQSRPLLDLALCDPRPSYEIVSTLLDSGADPNEYYCETTAWGGFLDWIGMGGVETEISFHYAEFKEILALLISLGAPLDYRLNSGLRVESVILEKFEPRDAEYILSKANMIRAVSVPV